MAKSLGRGILKYIFGESVPVVADIAIYYLDEDLNIKELFFTFVPLVGGLVYFFDIPYLSDEDDINSVDPLSTDPTSRKTSDTPRRINQAPRSEGRQVLGKLGSLLMKAFVFVLVAGFGLTMVMGAASFLGVIDSNPVMEYAGFTADKADDAAAGESDSVKEVSREARGPIEMALCVFSGPGCLRQKTAEKKPGSEDVGEKYGLKIENFRVGSGDGVDVSYQDPDTSIPVSFRVSNPMNGRKGIHARDVMYRIKVIDGDRGVDNPYCDTGWLHIGTADVDGDNEGEGGTDDIRRGTTAGTGFINIDGSYVAKNGVDSGNYAIRYSQNAPLTYKNCEMIQPALGEDRKIFLRLRYDYYSGGQVTFKAMSRDYMLSEGIKQKIQPSKAPDTPVQAAVNVKSPVTFTEENGVREPIPFGMDVFTETDDSGIRYRIQGIDVINSRFTSGMESSCSFINTKPGQRMELKDEISQRVIYEEDYEKIDYWYSKGERPSLIGCRMNLGDKDASGRLLNQISRTGETLAYRVRANYTVSEKEPLSSFKVSAATACDGEIECPRLVTLSYNSSNEDYNYKSVCSGVDAGYEGCGIVDGRWGEFDIEALNKRDTVVESGEVAVNLSKFDVGGEAAGFEKDKWKKLDSDLDGEIDSSPEWENYSVVRFDTEEGGSEIELLHLSKENCKNDNYKPGYPAADVFYYKCGSESTDVEDDSYDSTYDEEKQQKIIDGSNNY